MSYYDPVGMVVSGIGGEAEPEFEELYTNWLYRLVTNNVISWAEATSYLSRYRSPMGRRGGNWEGLPDYINPWKLYDILQPGQEKAQTAYLAETRRWQEKQETITGARRAREEEEAKWEARRGVQRAQAISGAFAGEPEEAGIPRAMPGMPGVEEILYPFLEGMPSAMRGYFEPRLGQIYGEFERKYPGARERWWKTLNPPREDRYPGIQAAREQLERLTPGWAPGGEFMPGWGAAESSAQYARALGRTALERMIGEMEAGAYPGTEAGGMGEARKRERPTPEDPLKAFMGQYPFLQKYMGVPPQQRGFYPGRVAPSARWYV